MKFGLRSIQTQLIASFLLFEVLALALFSGLLLHQRLLENRERVEHRLESQGAVIATLCRHALAENSAVHLQSIVSSMLELPTIQQVSFTAPGGLVLASSDPRQNGTIERTQWDSFLPRLEDSLVLRSVMP